MGESFGQLKSRLLTLTTLFLFGMFALLLSVVLVYVLGIVFIGFIQGWDNLTRTVTDPRKLQFFFEESRTAFTIFNLLAAFIFLRVYCWVMLAAVHAAMDESLGFRDSLKKGKGRGYSFIVLFLLLQVILQVGMMLFLLPGIALTVLLGFSFWVFAREEAGVFQSLRGSARIVKGHFFGVLGRMLLLGLIGAAFMIVPLLGFFVGGALMIVAWSLLYEDLRELSRQESSSTHRGQVAGRAAA